MIEEDPHNNMNIHVIYVQINTTVIEKIIVVFLITKLSNCIMLQDTRVNFAKNIIKKENKLLNVNMVITVGSPITKMKLLLN